MKIENSCHVCFSSGRKTKAIDGDSKSCFLGIVNEIPIVHLDPLPVWLCWECAALVQRFNKFKLQVKQAYTVFHQYAKQNGEQKLHSQGTSNLRICKVFNLMLPQETLKPIVNESLFEVIKPEKEKSNPEREQERIPISDIKIETVDSDNAYVYSPPNTEDDEKFLIEFSTKKHKKKSNKVSNGNMKKKKNKKVEKMIYKEIELSKQEIEGERKLLALREEYVNAMFKCDRCIISFPNADDLQDHLNIKHNTVSKFKCNICECVFHMEMSFSYHMNKHRKRYKCKFCEEMFISKRIVTKHYGIDHYGRLESKTNQEVNSIQQESQNLDNSTAPNTESFPCDFCEKVFKWKTSLRKHVETHRIESGQKRKPYCEPCKLSFTTTSNLQKHVKTSSKHQIQLKLRKLKESLQEDSKSVEKLDSHVEQIKSSVNNSREQFPCPQCDKRFQWRGNLQRHLMSHAARANGELVCAPCNRTFSSIATYNQHMKISKKHVSENDFKYMCSDCGKRFANKTRLKEHVDWEHLKNFVHTCAICEKVFKSHTSLYLHKQVVHKGTAEHLCDHCGKAFPNHAKLRSHIVALHTTESPYKCGWCSARFSWHSCLSRHVRRVHRSVTTKKRKGADENDEGGR